MSVCKYCGQKVGWFSDAHEDCTRKVTQGIESLKSRVADSIVQGKQYGDTKAELEKISNESFIPKSESLVALKEGWIRGAQQRSIAQPISDSEFSAISDFYRDAGLTQDEMRKTPGFRAMVFSYLIWTVLHDQVQPYDGPIHFNLQSGETAVFGIANVLLSEQSTKSTYVGGYSGVSVRIARGVYYHVGGTRGHREESSGLQEVDYGDFLMTTKAVYFGGTEKGVNFRLPFNQIVRFQPYSDAVGVCKNNGKEKLFAPQHVSDSGWFLFNVLQALAARDADARGHHQTQE